MEPCLVTVKPDGEEVVWLVGGSADLLNTVGADCAKRYPDHITFIWGVKDGALAVNP